MVAYDRDPRGNVDVERYTELRSAGRAGGIDRWDAVDSLTRERVSLWTTPVTDANGEAVRALRAEAARLVAHGVEARVFEDLRRGLVGLAFGGPRGASPTRPQTRVGETLIGDANAPAASAPLVAAAAPRRTRVGQLAAVAVMLAGASTAVTWWMLRTKDATRADGGSTGEEEEEERGAPTPTARPTATWRTATASEPAGDGTAADDAPPPVEPPKPDKNDSRCGLDVEISTGCIDRAPVRESDVRACKTCPPPTSSRDVVGGDAPTRAAMEDEFATCDRRLKKPPTGSARCAAFDVATDHCRARGGRVPTEAEWLAGEAAGMTTEPDLYEWTREVVRERMNWTRGTKGRSQADRHVRSPTLGFRCVR